MTEKKQHTIAQVVDEGSLHKYRTEIPNTVIRGIVGRDLTRDACWLYVYLKSVAGDDGACWQSTVTLAKGAKMSIGLASKAKAELVKAGIIRIVGGNQAKHESDRIRIVNIWDANMREFSASPHEPEKILDDVATMSDEEDRLHHMKAKSDPASPHEGAASPHEPGPASPHEAKKIPKKELRTNPVKKEESSPNGEDMVNSENRPPVSPKYTKAFEHFWEAYPSKKGKQGAWKSWKRQRLEAIGEHIIQSVMMHQSHDPDWGKGYIPHPATYLNQARWEDELPPLARISQSQKRDDGLDQAAARLKAQLTKGGYQYDT